MTEVKKISFLIHPNYLADQPGNPIKLKDHLLYQQLAEEYSRAASGMGNDELLVIITHRDLQTQWRDIITGQHYAKAGRDAYLAAPQGQAMIYENNRVPFSGADPYYDLEALRLIIRQAAARGFKITPNTKVAVFGEMRGECVQEAWNGIVNAGFFREGDVIINEQLTDKRQ